MTLEDVAWKPLRGTGFGRCWSMKFAGGRCGAVGVARTSRRVGVPI